MPVASRVVSLVEHKPNNKARALATARMRKAQQVQARKSLAKVSLKDWSPPKHEGNAQHMRVSLKTGVIDDRGNAKSLSRIPKQWSSMVREPAYPAIEYAPEYWLTQSTALHRFNPNPWLLNVSTVKYRELSEKLGRVITKTKTVYHGGYRQAPVAELRWRGPDCLFDWCNNLGDSRSRLANGHLVAYHVPIGTLPPYPKVQACKPRSLEIEAMLGEWKGMQQLSYLEAMGVQL